jgi:hypothetical protein
MIERFADSHRGVDPRYEPVAAHTKPRRGLSSATPDRRSEVDGHAGIRKLPSDGWDDVVAPEESFTLVSIIGKG